MSNVKILAGRIASMSYEFAKENDIILMPVDIVKGEEIIKDDNDEKATQFLKDLPTFSDIPSTSVPPHGQILEFLKENIEKEEPSIYIAVSSKLSGLYSAVSKVAEKLNEEDYNLKVFDTYTAISMQGMMAYQASQFSKQGDDQKEILEKLAKIKDDNRAKEYGVIETLKYLEKNGRIGKAKAWIANLFSFKPIISAKDGEIDPVARARSNDQALEIVIKKIKEDADRLDSKEMDVMYDYGLSDEYVKEVVAPRIEKEFNSKVISFNQVSTAIACHLGPEVWGVCAYHK